MLPLRHMFSIFFCFFSFWLLEFALSPSGKSKARPWCSSSVSTAASLLSAGASEAGSQAELGHFLKALPCPTDLQVSQRLSPCPIARIWLLDADTDGSLLQALAFPYQGKKAAYMLSLLLAAGIQLLDSFNFVSDYL